MDERAVLFPEEMLEEMKVEEAIFTPYNDKIGIAALSHTENSQYVLRLYHLLFIEDENKYKPVQELAAFSFRTYQELTDFVKRLPSISGLEMLMLLNPLPYLTESM